MVDFRFVRCRLSVPISRNSRITTFSCAGASGDAGSRRGSQVGCDRVGPALHSPSGLIMPCVSSLGCRAVAV